MMQVNVNGRSIRSPVARVVVGAIVIVVVALVLLLVLSLAGVALVIGGALLLGLGVSRLLLGGKWKRKKQEIIQEATVIESIQKPPHDGETRMLK